MKKTTHPRYTKIQAHQLLADLESQTVADHLGVSVRTYRDKINGSNDFTLSEIFALAELFGCPPSALI